MQAVPHIDSRVDSISAHPVVSCSEVKYRLITTYYWTKHWLGTRLNTGLGTRLNTGLGMRLSTGLGTRLSTGLGTRLSTGLGMRLSTGLGTRLSLITCY